MLILYSRQYTLAHCQVSQLYDSFLDQNCEEIWKKTTEVVIKFAVNETPSDELLALYLEVHNEYQVNNQNQLKICIYNLMNTNIYHFNF